MAFGVWRGADMMFVSELAVRLERMEARVEFDRGEEDPRRLLSSDTIKSSRTELSMLLPSNQNWYVQHIRYLLP